MQPALLLLLLLLLKLRREPVGQHCQVHHPPNSSRSQVKPPPRPPPRSHHRHLAEKLHGHAEVLPRAQPQAQHLGDVYLQLPADGPEELATAAAVGSEALQLTRN